MPRARNFPPLKVRLLKHVDVRPGQCWMWTGRRIPNGYGTFGKLLAHRLMYQEHVGPIPESLFVLHRCDVPACVNPEHLFPGTARDNSLDMVSKGRHGGGKLTRAQVDTIRARHEAGGITQLALAREHGVSEESINNIVCYRTWVAEAAYRDSGAARRVRSLFGMAATDTELLFIKLVALRASIDHALGGAIRTSGSSMEHTAELVLRFYDLRDALILGEPRVFADVPRHHFPVSIREQERYLRDVRRDLEHLLVLGEHAGLYSPAPATAVVPSATTPNSGRALALGKWLGNNLATVITGILSTVIATYLTLRYGFGK